MAVELQTIFEDTTAGTDILDLTPSVTRVVREFSVQNGSLTIFIPGSTGEENLKDMWKRNFLFILSQSLSSIKSLAAQMKSGEGAFLLFLLFFLL